MFQENIIKWYPFEKNKTIIQIGANTAITDELKKVARNVKCISSIEEIGSEAEYDYVIIYGYENYYYELEKIINIMNEDGKLLIIGNNKFGINNWSQYINNEESGVLGLEKYNEETKEIKKIKKELKRIIIGKNKHFLCFS